MELPTKTAENTVYKNKAPAFTDEVAAELKEACDMAMNEDKEQIISLINEMGQSIDKEKQNDCLYAAMQTVHMLYVLKLHKKKEKNDKKTFTDDEEFFNSLEKIFSPVLITLVSMLDEGKGINRDRAAEIAEKMIERVDEKKMYVAITVSSYILCDIFARYPIVAVHPKKDATEENDPMYQ